MTAYGGDAGGTATESRPLSAGGRRARRASQRLRKHDQPATGTLRGCNQCLQTLFLVRIREIPVRGKAPPSCRPRPRGTVSSSGQQLARDEQTGQILQQPSTLEHALFCQAAAPCRLGERGGGRGDGGCGEGHSFLLTPRLLWPEGSQRRFVQGLDAELALANNKLVVRHRDAGLSCRSAPGPRAARRIAPGAAAHGAAPGAHSSAPSPKRRRATATQRWWRCAAASTRRRVTCWCRGRCERRAASCWWRTRF